MKPEISPIDFIKKNVENFIRESLDIVKGNPGDGAVETVSRMVAESAIRHMVHIISEIDKIVAERKSFSSHAEFTSKVSEMMNAIEERVAMEAARVEGKLMAHSALASYSQMYDNIASSGIPATNSDGEPIVFDLGGFNESR